MWGQSPKVLKKHEGSVDPTGSPLITQYAHHCRGRCRRGHNDMVAPLANQWIRLCLNSFSPTSSNLLS